MVVGTTTDIGTYKTRVSYGDSSIANVENGNIEFDLSPEYGEAKIWDENNRNISKNKLINAIT